MTLIQGKFYVLDQFTTDGQPVSGPFDTREQAEKDRQALNIADDCFVSKYVGSTQEQTQ